MSISVTGGADSICALYDDLLQTATRFERAAADVAEVADYVSSWPVRAVVASGDVRDGFALAAALGSLSAPLGPIGLAVARLDDSAAKLRWVVRVYQDADQGSVFAAAGGVLHGLVEASGTAWATAFAGGGFSLAAQRAVTADTALFAAAAAPFTWVEDAAARNYPDGHAVVRPLGLDRRPDATRPPRGLADLVEQLAVRNDGQAGEVSVAFVAGADGRRRAVVDVPGTKSWSPGPTDNVTSLSTNARALVGARTAYGQGVLRAMTAAGVRPDEPVLIVGHSEGGMVAIEAARTAVQTGRFEVTHVLTAGSPIGRTVGAVPASVRVLALENRTDVLTELDSRQNPARPNVTTVCFDAGDGTIGGDHDLRGSYAVGAALADGSDNGSIRDFTDSARGFLSGTRENTHAYLITRRY